MCILIILSERIRSNVRKLSDVQAAQGYKQFAYSPEAATLQLPHLIIVLLQNSQTKNLQLRIF